MKDMTCKHCGAWEGLHHYETNQCPRNGMEAPVGRKQEWAATTFERDDSDKIAADIARAAYEQRMTDARRLYDAAQFDHDTGDKYGYGTLIYAFRIIAGQDAERKT